MADEVERVGETGRSPTEEGEDIFRQALLPGLFFVTKVEIKLISSEEIIRHRRKKEEKKQEYSNNI